VECKAFNGERRAVFDHYQQLSQASWRDASFAPNVTYYYVVSAVNAFGESPNSRRSARSRRTGCGCGHHECELDASEYAGGQQYVFRVTSVIRDRPDADGVTLGVGFNMDARDGCRGDRSLIRTVTLKTILLPPAYSLASNSHS